MFVGPNETCKKTPNNNKHNYDNTKYTSPVPKRWLYRVTVR